MLEVEEIRSEIQNAWDQVSALQVMAERVDLKGLTRPPPSSRPFRTDNVSRAELSSSGHGFPRPAAGSYAKHWTQATGVQRPPQASGLLMLPAEILDHILGYVVGHKVVHVDDAKSVEEEHLAICHPNLALCGVCDSNGPQFYLRICVAGTSEQTAWEQFTSGYDEVPDSDNEEYYVADGKHRHSRCRNWDSDTLVDCTTRWAVFDYPAHLNGFRACQLSRWAVFDYPAHLSVFRACSQLSLPAFRIFWATNTFSFATTATFRELLSNLNDSQKGTIRNININVETAPERMDFDPCQLMKLQTLDTLNLCLHSRLFGSALRVDNHKPDASEIDIRKQPVNYMLRLEAADIRRLNVIVYDSIYDDYHSHGRAPYYVRFTVGEKQHLADVVHAILTAPRADREVFAREDRQIFELEELVQGLRFAQDVRWQVQRRNLTS
ncbi:MAG: hypothetical protein Q9211_004314 [Gyalolechia sp. 1 TL-2023]